MRPPPRLLSLALSVLIPWGCLAGEAQAEPERSAPSVSPVRPAAEPAIQAAELLGHIQHLASPEMKGREAGTDGEKMATAYIAGEFERFGLEPLGDAVQDRRTFLQHFSLARANGVGPKTSLTLAAEGKEVSFSYQQKQCSAFPMHGGVLEAEGDVAFAGYGIHAPELTYDDFAGLDLAGKWALILRYEPQEKDPQSRFSGTAYTQHAALQAKVENCLSRKAVGVLIVTGPAGREKEAPKLSDGKGIIFGGVAGPVLDVTRETADRILSAAGRTSAELQAALDKDLANHSFVVAGVKLRGTAEIVQDKELKMANVVARLPGRDPQLKEEALVIGAHHDHLGMGAFGSTAGKAGRGQIHPGADDNASGTAGVLEIAQSLAALKPDERPRRSIVFVTFSGEEKGLLGSGCYVRQPPVPLSRTIGMINLDMIGRSPDGSFAIAGLGTAKELKDIVRGALQDAGLRPRLSPSIGGGSDHVHFYSQQLPVLFVFTSLTRDYHKPTDTWDKINAPVAEGIAKTVCRIARAWADRPERVEFAKAPAGGFMGIGLDAKREKEQGYAVGQVASKSPAEQAGLKAGDLISALNGKELTGPQDLSMGLLDFGPGDKVTLTVKRGTETLTIVVTLAQRGR